MGNFALWRTKEKISAQIAGVSTHIINKLNRNENVTIEVLAKIFWAFDCTMDDILEVVEDNSDGEKE